MREVISNTSPLQYLHQLDLLDVLPTLYGEVLVPAGVVREIAAGRSLGVDLPDMESIPWLRIREVNRSGVSIAFNLSCTVCRLLFRRHAQVRQARTCLLLPLFRRSAQFQIAPPRCDFLSLIAGAGALPIKDC